MLAIDTKTPISANRACICLCVNPSSFFHFLARSFNHFGIIKRLRGSIVKYNNSTSQMQERAGHEANCVMRGPYLPVLRIGTTEIKDKKILEQIRIHAKKCT